MMRVLLLVISFCFVVPFHASHRVIRPLPKSVVRDVQRGSHRIEWEPVDASQTAHVLKTYFHTAVDNVAAKSCEIFLIEGVPAAAMIYTNRTQHDVPMVDAFVFNKGLVLMFDLGPHIRKSLYEKYRGLTVEHAVNRLDFLCL